MPKDIGYNVRHDTDCERTPATIREMFARDYDPIRHYEEMRRAIQACIA